MGKYHDLLVALHEVNEIPRVIFVEVDDELVHPDGLGLVELVQPF